MKTNFDFDPSIYVSKILLIPTNQIPPKKLTSAQIANYIYLYSE
jgi:hypothetical protein